MNLRPFFSSIGNGLGNAGKAVGNAFKTGWNNGNIQKGMAITGMTAFGVGLTGAIIHDMNNSRGSIFGGCGCNSFGFGGGMNMFGCNPLNMGGINMFGGNPFNMGGMDMFGGMGMLNNMYGMGYNPYNMQMGNMMAYQWGQQLAMQQGNNCNVFNNATTEITDEQLDKIAPEHDNEDAGAIADNTDKTKGKAFDEGTSELLDSKGNINPDADPVKFATLDGDGRKGYKSEYVKAISDTAKSYIANIDSDNDGYISEEEFIEHEFEKAKGDQELSEAQETNLRNRLKMAYAQINLNRDENGIDWKEMSATIASYDAGGSGSSKLDGKITASNYSSAQSAILNGTLGKANWSNYRALFGKTGED